MSWLFNACDEIEQLKSELASERNRTEVFAKAVAEDNEVMKHLQAEIEKLREALEKIDSWTKAYPLEMFPEPDFKKVAEVLKAAGLSLDEVSASNMRHVITKLKDITEQALKEKDEQDTLD